MRVWLSLAVSCVHLKSSLRIFLNSADCKLCDAVPWEFIQGNFEFGLLSGERGCKRISLPVLNILCFYCSSFQNGNIILHVKSKCQEGLLAFDYF